MRAPKGLASDTINQIAAGAAIIAKRNRLRRRVANSPTEITRVRAGPLDPVKSRHATTGIQRQTNMILGKTLQPGHDAKAHNSALTAKCPRVTGSTAAKESRLTSDKSCRSALPNFSTNMLMMDPRVAIPNAAIANFLWSYSFAFIKAIAGSTEHARKKSSA